MELKELSGLFKTISKSNNFSFNTFVNIFQEREGGREREREGEKEKESEREKELEGVCERKRENF